MHKEGELLWARRHDRLQRTGQGVEVCFGCACPLAPGVYRCPTCGPSHFGARPSFLRQALGWLVRIAFLASVALGVQQFYALVTGP